MSGKTNSSSRIEIMLITQNEINSRELKKKQFTDPVGGDLFFHSPL